MKLNDRVAIVTGGGRNIGRSISLALAREGAEVVIADLDFDSAVETGKEIESSGGNCMVLKVDLSRDEEINKLVKTVLNKYDRIDILVNNAGVQLNKECLLDLCEHEWDYTMLVNARSVCFLSKAVATVMKEKDGGKIINVASISGRIFSADNLAYAISKAAVTALTSQMAVELAPYKINVNALAPGYVDTEFNRETLARPNAREEISKTIPLGRLAQPDDISGAAVFLASDEASYITGHAIVIDGGYTLL